MSLRIIDHSAFLPICPKFLNGSIMIKWVCIFKDVLSALLSAFRKRYGCHHVLTKWMENSKLALDEGEHVGLILLDLSKAFESATRATLV